MATTKKLSYLSRTFQDYKNELEKFTQQYYPNILSDFNDAAVGSWFIDLNAGIGDALSQYIDRSFQETNIDQAQMRSSLLSIARTKGLKIPGRKASLVEVEISCDIPQDVNGNPDPNYLPIIRRGSQVTGGGKTFELLYDTDFGSQFSQDGISNRQIIPKRNTNGNIIGYTVKKLEIMSGSQSKTFKLALNDYMITPFMEVILPDTNVLEVSSIIFKEGIDYKYTPSSEDFSLQVEYLDKDNTSDGRPTWKYFEVENLLQDKLFLTNYLDNGDDYPIPDVRTEYFPSDDDTYNVSVIKGGWKSIKQKYITEYTNKGYMKITFGSGSDYGYYVDESNLTPGQIEIRRIIDNMNMGVLPKPGWTMFIQYRIGGGSDSNIAANVINTLSYKNIDIKGDGTNSGEDASKKNAVDRSITVTNPNPSVSGKDEPTENEIRYMIKYNNQSQDRCVVLKDYIDRINKMPAIYGCPYRTGIIEKNNMILTSILSVDDKGKLTDNISQTLIDNISDYLSEYKLLTDYVVIKPGKIINLQVECDLIIDKAFNTNDVVRNVINSIQEFFDVKNHKMGENIYVSDLNKNILGINGVKNLIEVRIYNIFDGNYSSNRISQTIVSGYYDNSGNWISANIDGDNRKQIDLTDSDGILFSDTDSMFEIKNVNSDIKIRVKSMN